MKNKPSELQFIDFAYQDTLLMKK